MDKNRPYTNNFLKGLTSLTGIPIKKIQEYAKENNPFNILEHPKVIEPNDKQLQKIPPIPVRLPIIRLLQLYTWKQQT